MTKRKSNITKRNRPVVVYTTQTAEWDIADWRVSETLLAVICEALAAVPVSERDVVEGTIRHRQFDDFVVIFHYMSTADEFIVDICGIRPPKELNKTKKVLKQLERLAVLVDLARGVTGA
jgi:hypothetical protein